MLKSVSSHLYLLVDQVLTGKTNFILEKKKLFLDGLKSYYSINPAECAVYKNFKNIKLFQPVS
jgi:hypothetical protein